MEKAQPIKAKAMPQKVVSTMTAANRSRQAQPECPLFLRKTYHMVDTCDPKIAGWADDGETFVVKNPETFEKTIIPQFFKHSKFSSFVRQLNFYGFRKIKYNDSIRIDRKLEAETANFWKFRHESFQKGKPELLVDIKRSSSTPTTVVSNTTVEEQPQEVGSLKSEVTALKKRIATMSKNIDDLSSLVQKLGISKPNPELTQENAGMKRKKVQKEQAPNEVPSGVVTSSTQLIPQASRAAVPLSYRQESNSSSVSDDDFVAQLFTAFETDDLGFSVDDTMEIEPLMNDSQTNKHDSQNDNSNAPDSALMRKMSDALALLPRNMQELLVERLVASITSMSSVTTNFANPATVVDHEDSVQRPIKNPTPPRKAETEAAFPIAAATLGALLSQYASDFNDTGLMAKSVPIIPVHA